MVPRDIPGSNLPLFREQRPRKGFSKEANCKSLGTLSYMPSQLLTVPSQRKEKEKKKHQQNKPAFHEACSFCANLVPSKLSFQMK